MSQASSANLPMRPSSGMIVGAAIMRTTPGCTLLTMCTVPFSGRAYSEDPGAPVVCDEINVHILGRLTRRGGCLIANVGFNAWSRLRKEQPWSWASGDAHNKWGYLLIRHSRSRLPSLSACQPYAGASSSYSKDMNSKDDTCTTVTRVLNLVAVHLNCRWSQFSRTPPPNSLKAQTVDDGEQ